MIVAANRGPVTYERSAAGVVEARRGAGGLVSALRGLIGAGELRWIASALSDADREIARAHPTGRSEELSDGAAYVRLLSHEPRAYAGFYNEISTALWSTQHQLWNLPYEPSFGARFLSAWDDGYAVVNEAFATAMVEELAGRAEAPVIVHDYHLYLAPKVVRRRVPNAALALFVHIPWPPPDAFGILPAAIARQILEGLLACDLIGFHTQRWRDNFGACCEALGVALLPEAGVARTADRTVRLTARPISVSPRELREAASDGAVARERTALRNDESEQLIVRVDRTDPSKNIVRGFEAFELLLERHDEHRGRVRMLALLNPSRQNMPAYAAYSEAIAAAAGRINTRFAFDSWAPVHLDVDDNYARALAAYQTYDVLFVNPLFDGMNLVAKEGPLLNERAGVVVLSDNAGAHAELAAHVTTVSPFDVDQQARALHEALTMGRDERVRRAEALRAAIEASPVDAWSDLLLDDLAEIVEADGRRIAR